MMHEQSGYFDCRSLDFAVFVAFKAPYLAERLGLRQSRAPSPRLSAGHFPLGRDSSFVVG